MKKENQTDSVKGYEFTDDELESVVGGAGTVGGGSLSPVGPYYSDSYGGGSTQTRAIGWSGLTLGRVFSDGRATPYEIKHNGTTVGWAPGSSVSFSEE